MHYLDRDLFLNYHCLGVRENKEQHTDVNYREDTDSILDEFQIKEKVVLFVTDNEAKMKAAFKDDERSGDGPHILHKSALKGLDEVVPIKNLVEKVRQISKRHNKSYALRYGLQERTSK